MGRETGRQIKRITISRDSFSNGRFVVVLKHLQSLHRISIVYLPLQETASAITGVNVRHNWKPFFAP